MQSARPSCTLWELPEAELQLCDDSAGISKLTTDALAALDAAGAAVLLNDDGDAAAACGPVSHACKTCGAVEADTPEDWRAHFCSDWHRFNLRRRTAGRPAVSEAEFGAMVTAGADDVGSISGSESEDSEDEDRSSARKQQQQQRTPHFVFGPPGGRRLAVWRALVAPEPPEAAAARGAGPPASPQDCLAALRALRSGAGELRAAVIMLRGGHFAAAAFALQPARVANPRLSEKERFGLVAHKSAHRYVVRAGQGGKQSSKDASGKFARSAGSRLRRYNEAALRRDVEEGLRELGPALASCHLLFLHAPGSNAQQLLGGEAPPLDRADPRLRRVPFTTRRPTLSEAQRVMRLLVSVWSLEDVLGQQAAAAEAAAEQQQQLSAEDAAAEAAERERKQQQRAVAASRAAEAAAAQAAAEEEARRRRADKKARQKASKEEQRRAAAAARREEAQASNLASDAAPGEADLISAAAARVAAASSKLEARPAKVSSGAGRGRGQDKAKASGGAVAALPRAVASRPRPGEDAALRRARIAAAAEARAKALEAAMAAQKLH